MEVVFVPHFWSKHFHQHLKVVRSFGEILLHQLERIVQISVHQRRVEVMCTQSQMTHCGTAFGASRTLLHQRSPSTVLPSHIVPITHHHYCCTITTGNRTTVPGSLHPSVSRAQNTPSWRCTGGRRCAPCGCSPLHCLSERHSTFRASLLLHT